MSVEGQDERKIEEYLDKQGITSMQDVGIKKVVSSNFNQMNCHIYSVIRQKLNTPKMSPRDYKNIFVLTSAEHEILNQNNSNSLRL